MPLKLPYLSLGLGRPISGRAPSIKPWNQATQNKSTEQDPVQKLLVLTQGGPRPLEKTGGEQHRHSICAPTRSHHQSFYAAAKQSPPAVTEKENPRPILPEGFEMSEAEIEEREMDPTDRRCIWPLGPDGHWLEDVPGPGEQVGGAGLLPKGPYVKTKEGLVHIARYYL